METAKRSRLDEEIRADGADELILCLLHERLVLRSGHHNTQLRSISLHNYCSVDIEGSVIVTMRWRSWGYDVYLTLFVIVKRR